jgi:hypothetical protein
MNRSQKEARRVDGLANILLRTPVWPESASRTEIAMRAGATMAEARDALDELRGRDQVSRHGDYKWSRPQSRGQNQGVHATSRGPRT